MNGRSNSNLTVNNPLMFNPSHSNNKSISVKQSSAEKVWIGSSSNGEMSERGNINNSKRESKKNNKIDKNGNSIPEEDRKDNKDIEMGKMNNNSIYKDIFEKIEEEKGASITHDGVALYKIDYEEHLKKNRGYCGKKIINIL